MIRLSSLKLSQGETAADLIERDMFLCADTLFAEDLGPFVCYFLGFALVFVDLEFLTGLGAPFQSQEQDG